jgi:hypothetical protein
MNLSFPLASSDLGAEALENEFILNNMHLLQVLLSAPSYFTAYVFNIV